MKTPPSKLHPLPPKSDPRWRAMVLKNISHQFKFMAAGLCLARNIREITKDPTEERILRGIDEFYAFCEKYQPLLQEDLIVLFPQGEQNAN